jgi:hypothetical protein
MADRPTDPDSDARYRTPGWVKLFTIMAVVVVLLIGVILITGLGGPHGPQRHGPGGSGPGAHPVAVGGDATIS